MAARSGLTTGRPTRRAPRSGGPCRRRQRARSCPMAPDEAGVVIHVLLVEDDPGDVLITREAFAENKVRNHLSVVNDGVKALQFLRREAEYASAPRPDLILLDLNLPRMDGHEVLANIKSD